MVSKAITQRATFSKDRGMQDCLLSKSECCKRWYTKKVCNNMQPLNEKKIMRLWRYETITLELFEFLARHLDVQLQRRRF